MLFNKLIHFVLVVILALILVASVQAYWDVRMTLIQPDIRFCLIMPDAIGIPLNDYDGIRPWCTSLTNAVHSGKEFPTGFIKSAHYAEGPDGRWTQVTGRIDRTKFGLSSTDPGKQSWIVSPNDSTCVGFWWYIQYVEPIKNIYCLRCCHDESDCSHDKDNRGCQANIPGDYS